MESRLEKIFSMGINSMSLALWLGEDRKCSAAVVGLDLLLGLSMVRRCSLNRSFKRRFVSHIIKKHFNMLLSSNRCKSVFQHPPVVAFRCFPPGGGGYSLM